MKWILLSPTLGKPQQRVGGTWQVLDARKTGMPTDLLAARVDPPNAAVEAGAGALPSREIRARAADEGDVSRRQQAL